MNKPRLQFLFGTFLSIILIYLIVYRPHLSQWFKGGLSLTQALFGDTRLDFGHILDQLLKVNLIPLALCFLINPIHILVRSHRWVTLIAPLARVNLRDSISIQHVGYFANVVLPLRIGELLRAVLIGNRAQLSKSSALATVVLERALDGVSLVALIMVIVVSNALLFNAVPGFSGQLGSAAAALSAGVLVLSAAVVFLLLKRAQFSEQFNRLVGFLPKPVRRRVSASLEHFISGFGMLKVTRHYSTVIIETGLLWVLYAAQVFLAIKAFGFDQGETAIAASPIFASFIILLFGAVGLSVPSAPAGVGTFHAAVILGLSALGFEDADASAGFAVVLHSVTTFYYIIAGIPMMWREGMHFGELKGVTKQTREGPA